MNNNKPRIPLYTTIVLSITILFMSVNMIVLQNRINSLSKVVSAANELSMTLADGQNTLFDLNESSQRIDAKQTESLEKLLVIINRHHQ